MRETTKRNFEALNTRPPHHAEEYYTLKLRNQVEHAASYGHMTFDQSLNGYRYHFNVDSSSSSMRKVVRHPFTRGSFGFFARPA